MNRIEQLFQHKKKNVLSIYFTAGFPAKDTTRTIIEALQKSGADLIEIGLPFSDPLADGPTIQHSSEVALKNGMNTSLLFEQLKDIRKVVTIPLILMGYLNPVMQYGVENFCKKAAELGVDGIILPDLPMQEYLDEYKPIFEKYGLINVFLITPQTAEQRIRFIDEHSKGFIYMVSSASTTGAKDKIQADQEAYFKRIQAMKLKNPTLIGFGISDAHTFATACEYSHGAIIGSAFIKAVENSKDLKTDVQQFIANVAAKKVNA